MARRWCAFWFEPSLPTDLGVARATFFAGLLVMNGLVDFRRWGVVSAAFWMPIPVFNVFHLAPASPVTLGVIQTVWMAALALSAAGLLTRISMAISFVLGFYLLGLPHNFGHTYHFDALLVCALGILAFSRAGDAFSIDACLDDHPDRHPSGEYTWPIRAIWLAMSLVFFAAGVSKLRYGGFQWVTSSNMSIVLNRAVYHVSDADPLTLGGLWIASHRVLSSIVAGISLVIELGFITVLFSRKARLVFVPAAFAMLVGIRVLMGPTFGGFLIANVFWVPWRALGLRAAATIGAREPRRRAAPTAVVPEVDPGASAVQHRHARSLWLRYFVCGPSLTPAPSNDPPSSDGTDRPTARPLRRT